VSIHARTRGDAGFTLVELLVAMTITLIVLAGTVLAMANARRASETARAMTTMNSNLRTGMDLMVRDFLQVGQGLPAGRVVAVPNGAGATPIVRPGPPGTALTFDPASPVLSAVTPGPGLGPVLNGTPTDIVSVLAADPMFENVNLTALGAQSMTVTGTVNITDGGADDIRAGDLIMLTKGASSALMYVTRVSGQTVFFDPGDPMNLNQYDASLTMLGTLDRHRATAPPEVPSPTFVPSVATRLRLISYYIDATTDPAVPRLVRRINADPGRTVGFDLDNLQVTYDLADGVTNPANVRMDAGDLAGGGACAPDPCSPNQIRKINVFLAGRSAGRSQSRGDFLRNSLATQVSLRSMAFVDRYR
jgi:prepilin-type N-terminal cleavage/methylation domain-containing protein